MTYLMNCWYVAGWSEDLAEGALLARRFLDQPVVMFRSQDGVHALADRCPHRFAPLSFGALEGDTLRCGYHGLRFDGAGNCVHSPQTPGEPPARAKVRVYPLLERQSLLWIWMGDPALADEGAIPDFPELEQPETWRPVRGDSVIPGHYLLAVDNLMDLSHPEFLHEGTLGSPALSSGQYEFRIESPRRVHSNRWFTEGPIPPLLDRNFPTNGAPVEHWVNMCWVAPSNIWQDVGATFTGRPRSEGLNSRAAHFLTPETGRSTHYFWASLRGAALESEELDGRVREGLRSIFEGEDSPMIAGVQDRMGDADLWDLKPVLLGDTGAVRVRRALEDLLRAEQAEAGPAVA